MNRSISVRQHEILESIRLNGSLTSREIAQRWKISVGTARRDVDRLSAFDVVRGHGGGMLSSLSPTFGEGNHPGDRALLERAIGFVEPGMSIGLCAGTHDVALARLLAQRDQMSIVTNSIRSAQVLWRMRSQRRGEIQVVLTPGHVNNSGELVGPVCTTLLRSLSFDLTIADARKPDPNQPPDAESLESADVFEAFRHSSNRLVMVDELDTSNDGRG